MKAVQGQPVKERVHVTGTAGGALKAVIASYQQRVDAERDHLEKEFENMAMQGDEDPKLFLARAEKKQKESSVLSFFKSDRKVVRIFTRRLPHELYDLEQRTSLVRPVLRDRIWRKESSPPTPTARRRRWRVESWRQSYRRLQHRWRIPTPSPSVGFQQQQQQRRYVAAGPQRRKQRHYGGAEPKQQQRQYGGDGPQQQQ